MQPLTYTSLFLIFILLHYIGDFLLQPKSIDLKKSYSLKYLTIHSILYIMPFLSLAFFIDLKLLVSWILINFILHFIIDYVVSVHLDHFWQLRNLRMFTVFIASDHVLHVFSLVLTYLYLSSIII